MKLRPPYNKPIGLNGLKFIYLLFFLYTYNSTIFSYCGDNFFRLCRRRFRLICSRSLKFDACDVINEKKEEVKKLNQSENK